MSVAGRVERSEHPLERAGELRDFIVGLRMGDAPARVSGALDLASDVAQLGDRAHRTLCGRQPGEQCQDRAAEHAEDQKEAHARERVVDVGQRSGVEELDLTLGCTFSSRTSTR